MLRSHLHSLIVVDPVVKFQWYNQRRVVAVSGSRAIAPIMECCSPFESRVSFCLGQRYLNSKQDDVHVHAQRWMEDRVE